MAKSKGFSDGKTELTVECITKCANKAIYELRANEISIRVDESQKSDSKYLVLEIGTDSLYKMRFSDHETLTKYWDRQMLVRVGTTRNKTVIATIKNGIRILRKKHIAFVMKNVEEARNGKAL